ncbi:hypothetical protein [Allokutzneria multivorans]|uniref:hypothetical protein n=1 Tax=Allokutzneria multivorans TaxID=1142134 RepID=UPI0031E9C9CB
MAASEGNSSVPFFFHSILLWLKTAFDTIAFSARPFQSLNSASRTTWVPVEVPILSRLTARYRRMTWCSLMWKTSPSLARIFTCWTSCAVAEIRG